MSELYVLTDPIFTPKNRLFSAVKELFLSSVKWVQYRDKSANSVATADAVLLSEIAAMATEFGANFIINDSVELAAKTSAQGVHLGSDDGDIKGARKILGDNKIIGSTCYQEIKNAVLAANNGASYAAFGAAFKSQTKPNAPLVNHKIIIQAKSQIKIPVAIIGGINKNNIAQIAALKPDLIAICAAAFEGGNIAKNITDLKAILDK